LILTRRPGEAFILGLPTGAMIKVAVTELDGNQLIWELRHRKTFIFAGKDYL